MYYLLIRINDMLLNLHIIVLYLIKNVCFSKYFMCFSLQFSLHIQIKAI